MVSFIFIIHTQWGEIFCFPHRKSFVVTLNCFAVATPVFFAKHMQNHDINFNYI